MKSIISKLPGSFSLLYCEDGYIYSSYGIISNNSKLFPPGKLLSRREKAYFVEIEQNTLILKRIEVINNDDSIIFDSGELARYTYDYNYRELNVEFEHFAELEDNLYPNEIERRRREIFNNYLLNIDVFHSYIAKLVTSDNYYETFVKENLMYFNAFNIFTLYMSKVNKAFELLLENKMYHEIEYLLKNGVAYDEFGYEINARTIRLAKNLTMVETSGIITSSKLLQKFNINEIDALMKVAAYFKFSCNTFWNTILEMDVNLTEFSNYLIRSIFINDNLEYKDGHSSSARMQIAVTNFAQLFRDYLNMKEVDEPIYPDNLKEAHDLAADSYEKRRREKIEQERIEAFSRNVDNYRNLIDEVDDYKFIVPEEPDDLIKEGRRMNHCVGGYVNNVINGISKIIFVRKEDEPYITIEVRGKAIVQAKKFRNERPDENDDKLIRNWTGRKELTVQSY
jgi:hypothetical protein